MVSSIKSYLGVIAAVFLTPLLFFNNLVLLYVVLVVVLFTVLETLPLAVVSMCPWLGVALIGASSTDRAYLLTNGSAELTSLAGFLIVYLVVELTRLWTRLSLLLLRSQGLRVWRLSASVMLVTFVASLVLPAAFVTLLLVACICRLADNVPDDAAVLSHQQQTQPSSAPVAQTLTTETRVNSLRCDSRVHQLLDRSPPKRDSSPQTSSPEESPLSVSRYPWVLVRLEDVFRQTANALRSACLESRQLRLLRAQRRSQEFGLTDTQISVNSSMLHATRTTATAGTTPQELSRALTSRLADSSVDQRISRSRVGKSRYKQRSARHVLKGSVDGAPALDVSVSRSPTKIARDFPSKKALQSSLKSPLGSTTPHSTGSRASNTETDGRPDFRLPTTNPPISSPHDQGTLHNSGRHRMLVQAATMPSKPVSNENKRPSHGPLASAVWTALSSAEMSVHHKATLETTVFRRNNRPQVSPSKHVPVSDCADASVGESRIPSSGAAYKRIQKVLMVGVAYTSIMAGECALRSRVRLTIDAYYATIKKPSPFVPAYLTFLIPVTVVSVFLFWVFIYNIYLRDEDLGAIKECRVVIQKILEEKWQHEDKITPKEVLGILMLAAVGLSFAIDTDKYISADATTVSSLCVLVAVGIPPELGNPMLAGHGFTWQIVLRRMPWELILGRLGGIALELLAKRSVASTWLLESGLMNSNTSYGHPVWCQVTLMVATAFISEVDTGDVDPRFFSELVVLAGRFQKNPLYFALPVTLEDRWVLLMPYTRLPLIFLHLYANMSCSELLWLGLLLKVISSVTSVLAANLMLIT